ncbi:Queuine tRNA-ribosyltransferase accessory subunit 2 [Chlorella vulgaris]
MAFAQQPGGGPTGWQSLPHTCLQGIFDRLDLPELAAAASTCSTWRLEASFDARWRAFWQRQVSDVGLWRWAKADGDYRQQLRARHLVRRGDCVASVFPFSRRDGPVGEVLMFDGGPRDADKRILTVQAPAVPGHTVRLQGSCLKVWDTASLMRQRPLLTVHDVLKHMQLEDGRLFMWRIADDAVVPANCFGLEDSENAAEAALWAEHAAIRASVLEPGALALRDVPLDATFGRRMTPAEYIDMSGGLVAGSLMVPSQGRLIMRLFDLASGRCLRATSCAMLGDEPVQFQDHEVTMIVTRSGETGTMVVATCALFDTRIYMWRIRDEWTSAAGQHRLPAAGAGAAAAAAAAAAAGSSSLQPAGNRAAAWDGPAAAAALAAARGGADGADSDEQYELRLVYCTPEDEPVVDISISTTAHKLFIIGMEHIFIADLSGVPYMKVSLSRWRGIVPQGQWAAPADVGAFSWPLPNSTKTAFFLDTTHSLFIAEFRRPQMHDFWYTQPAPGAAAGRHPRFDNHIAEPLPGAGPEHGAVLIPFYIQSHTDLRPSPTTSQSATVHGRPAAALSREPGIVEYTQDGGVIITSADSSCPAVAALLGHEKVAGSYLEGLGPATGMPRGGAGGASGRKQPFISRGGRGQKGQLAPRALVLIDTNSGCRYKAVPLEGVCESVHSAGQYVVCSVAEQGSYPEGASGSLVVLDFGGTGLGVSPTPSPSTAATARAAAQPGGKQQQQQQQQQHRRRQQRAGGKSTAAAQEEEEEEGHEEEQQEQQQQQQQQQKPARRRAKPKDPQRKQQQQRGGGGSSRNAAAAAAADEEAGPSQKPRHMMEEDDGMEDMDDSFFSAIDQLVAKHKEQHTQAVPPPLRGSQPSSPGCQPAAASLPQPMQPFKQQMPLAPLQQRNGLQGPRTAAHHAQAAWQQGAGAHYGNGGGPASGRQQQQQQQQQHPPSWAQHPVGSSALQPQEAQGRLAQLQAELSRTQSQNKLLASNLQQKDRELSGLRQQKAQLERAAQGSGGGGAPPRPFAVGEMQKQLELAQKQLAFKESEMEDLRRQHAERTERLRQAEASVAELRQGLKLAGQEAAAAAAAAAAAVSGQGAALAAASVQGRSSGRTSTGRAQSSDAAAAAAAVQLSGGQKRRSLSSGTAGGTAAQASGAAVTGGGAAGGGVQPGGCGAAAADSCRPLLDPAVLAAASSLTSSASVVSRLMAACSASMGQLVGAGVGGAPHGGGSRAAPAPTASTALLLRSRLAATAHAPDVDSLAFTATFAQRVQQVACGMLPPSVLLDSIGSLAAASLVQLHGGAGGAAVSAAAAPLLEQRLRLTAAGLHVAQHLLELDPGCRAAALAPGIADGGSITSLSAAFSPAPARQPSSRVQFSCNGAAAVVAAPLVGSLIASTTIGGAALPGTVLVVQRHPAVFAGLQSGYSGGSGKVLLPVVLAVALRLGQQHEAVLAAALGVAVEMARAVQGEARAAMAPLFTSGSAGAVELFMQAPPLRSQALRLLHLLLEAPPLAALFEGSLGLSAAARGDPAPPTATGATSGTSGGLEGGAGSSTPAAAAEAAAGGPAELQEQQQQQQQQMPMQLDGGSGGENGGGGTPWLGAALIAEILLDSFALDIEPPLAGSSSCSRSDGGSELAPSTSSSGPGVAACGGGGVAAARAAMQLVAMLREERHQGILLALLLDDALGAPGCMLAQRLIQLAEAATAQPGEEASLMLLCPEQWPTAQQGQAAPLQAAASGSGVLLQQQAGWQQRLRVVQEALTLLRGLLVEDSTRMAAIDDLATMPAAARLTLTTLSRLACMEAPPPPAAAVAPPPPPLPLAPWARAIGSATDYPSVAEAGGGSSGALGGLPGMFTIDRIDGGARCGVLSTPSGKIVTPDFLVYTHRGSPLNLTPDMLETLKDVQALSLDVLQFLTQPKPEVLRGFPGSGRRFLAMDGRFVLGFTMTVHTGSSNVTPAQYMQAVAALAPDVWVALSDDVPSDCRPDRAAKAVDRSAAWLSECMSVAAAAPELSGAAVFAAVQGGQYLRERQRCAETMAAQPGVAGFVLAGLGTGESPSQRQQIVEQVVQRLPAAAPRLLCSVGTPEEVLEAVAQGIDLFDMGYLAGVTAGGYALSFPLDAGAQQQQQQQQQQPMPANNGSASTDKVPAAGGSSDADAAADGGQDCSKINLWAVAYRTDKRPLLPGCNCFACANHTRAYLHHLLQAHEMTAQVLLEVHNTHHYMQFFKAIRASIAAGTFATYHEGFLQRRQRLLMGAGG